ncbi:hypothetical protein PFISCL1PPCAC_5487, partial [Pristionchus fissidentatus]
EAKSMVELSGKMNIMCTQLINSIESSPNVDFALRKTARKAVTDVKSKSSVLEKALGNYGVTSRPFSVGVEDLRDIEKALDDLVSASDELPAIQGESTSTKIIGQIDNLSQFDRENLDKIGAKGTKAIENPAQPNESTQIE